LRAAEDRGLGDLFQLVLLVVGAVVMMALLTLVVRGQRGLLGVLLAILAFGLLAYWVNEIRAALRGGADRMPKGIGEQWIYDLVRRGEGFLFIAEVPGPEEEVSISVIGRTVEVFGGGGFHRVVKLPKRMRLSGFSYLNGVLKASLEEDGRAVESARDVRG
jgi:HSP20 family protein